MGFLDGQRAVVVGAGSGIGAAAAAHLASAGAVVACLDRDVDSAGAVASAIGGTAYDADVTDSESMTAAFAQACAEFGDQVHVVVNSAGITGPLGAQTHEVDLDEFDATYRVNLRGALVVSQLAARHMLPYGYGRIVHVASIAGKEGNPGMVAYSATKAGLIGLVKSQGKEYAESGVTVNAVAPAVIATDFVTAQPADVVKFMTDKIPMRRMGSVDEVAALIGFIASPACSFTTGFTFDATGGRATY